jgi:hypothetical protein
MISLTRFAMLWVIDRGQRMCFVFLAPLQGAICFLGGRFTHDFIMGWYESSRCDGRTGSQKI